MPYLDAALAFALTMLAVSTLVTQIVRLFRNTAKVRQAGLQEMLKDYYDNELKPVVERELQRLKSTAGTSVVKRLNTELQKFNSSVQLSNAKREQLVEMTTDEITERLKRTKLGEQLLINLGDKAQDVFNELGKRYEVVGKKATESFRTKSKYWAFGVAIFVAFALNVDSLYIANTYIKNEGMRQAVIAQKESLEQGYTTLNEKLVQEQEKTEITKEEFEAAFGDAKEQLDIFTSAGFPIGWAYYPHACAKAPETPDCQTRGTNIGFVMWFLGCALTGLLAGLGGPFWYDVVRGISRTVQTAKDAK